MALFEAPAPMQAVIASVISRCRSAGDAGAVISVTLSCSEPCDGVDRSRFSLSVSDNGPSVIGKWMDDFCHRVAAQPSALDQTEIQWDKAVDISTPDNIERKMRNYQLKFNQSGSPQILELLPQWREKRTLVSMLIEGPTTETVSYFRDLLEKFAIPSIEGVFLEWHYVSRRGERQTFQSREFVTKGSSDLDGLATGFTEFLLDDRRSESHRIATDTNLNVGQGISDAKRFTLHACVAVAAAGNRSASSSTRTKIMYFEDFVYSPTPSSMLQLLQKVDWIKFNLAVESVDMETATFAWECSKLDRIELILHKISKGGGKPSSRSEAKQVKQAIEGALHELKVKLPDVFASPQAIKTMECVPDLSRCIAGLIKSSTDASFVAECASMMGLLPGEIDKLEDQIKDKLSAIVTNADNSSISKISVDASSSRRESGNASDDSGEERDDLFAYT